MARRIPADLTMDSRLCSWHSGGRQCPRPWATWATVMGKNRPVCREHEKTQSGEHGDRIMEDAIVAILGKEAMETSDETICRKVARIARMAAVRDRKRVLMTYQLGVLQAKDDGADGDEAHVQGLLKIWRDARYPEGDPRREGG